MFNLKWEFVRSSNWQKLIQLISALQTLWSSRFSVSLFNCLICCFQRISPYFHLEMAKMCRRVLFFLFLFLSSCSLSPFLPSSFEVHWNHTTVLSNVVPVICKHLQKMSIQMYCKCGTISMFYILFYFVVWFWMDIKNVTMISLLLSFVPIIFFFSPSVHILIFIFVGIFIFIRLCSVFIGFHWTPHNPNTRIS